MLTIIRAGICTSLQDAGRYGWRHYGISCCGVLDNPAMQIANRLVGNKPDDAVLEITLGQFTAEFGRHGWIALTGAECHALLDDQPIWTGWRTAVRKGQRLTLNMPQHGMRSYLAIDGGFAPTPQLGSVSTDMTAGFAGFQGRKIQPGDRLPLGEATQVFHKPAGVRQLLWQRRVRALPGPEYDQFSIASQAAFWRTAWRLSPQSNRMGYRLQGLPLRRNVETDLLSHGLLPGVVQVPANGQPIVLLADAQTTGGYPRIACVIDADLYHFAQLRLGETVQFSRCSLEEARNARHDQQRILDYIARGLTDENRS